MHQYQKGFVLAFVIAVIAGLSVMTTAMFFYYDNDLKSVSRNSVMQQVTLAAETGLQEGQKYIEDRLNTNSFELVDIKNNLKVVQSDNKCLNRHGFTDSTKDVFYAKRISQTLTNNASGDDRKFAGMSYEVFIQRHADVVRSLYFSGQGPSNKQNQNTNYEIRSFAMVEPFYDFPDRRFTIEWWMKDKNAFSNRDTQIWEWGRRRDLVFKIKNDKWNPRMNQTLLVRDGETVGVPIKNEWVHLAMVWDGGNPRRTDRDNVRIYQNGVLQGTYSIDVVSRKTSRWRNPPEQLLGKDTTFIFGEGFDGYAGRGMTGKRKMSSIPFVGHVAEMRLWNISRTQQDIADNMNKRITGSEPGLVSYYKFNEGSGNTAKDFSTTRSVDKKNDARIYGLENVGTRWALELAKYVVVADTGSSPPVQRFPPGEDITYYKIMSCGIGPQGQLVPLELMVSAPGQKGDVGDGKVGLTEEDLANLTGDDGTSKVISLSKYIAQTGVTGDIKIPDSNNTNTGFDAFKRSMEQCNNTTTFSDFSTTSAYQEGDCVIFENKTYILEKDEGVSSGNNFNIDDWQEILGSGCDGVQFVKGGDGSHRHYYKYFATAPDLSSDVGYNWDSVDWFEAKRRAERSTCGGMRGYLVSIDSAAENEFIRQAVMCDNSTSSGCIGAKPFHVQAGKTRGQYYGNRMDQTSDQHYIWLGNSDFRTPGTMRSESGPNIGQVNSYTNWQNNEPNEGGEDFADMEINRANRVNGKWNDLRRIPGCFNNALDCITGYVVEYGGFDSFRLNHDDANDKKDINDNTKFCVARATIEKDKYVSAEDVLKYNTQAEDYESTIVPASTTTDDSNTSDEWPGWNQNTGVLTLEHSSKPTTWSPTSNYSTGNFVWYNNRVWKALKNITGGSSLTPGNTPTIYNISAWELYSGNETDAPCAAVSTWTNAFESIQYFNKNEVTGDDEVNPFANEAGGTNQNTESSASATLGERVILFTLGPLHVNKHLDGFNHFYEFYQFPVSTSGKAYNNRNTRFSEGYKVANRLHYFAKTGYLATITSETENEVVAEKAKGNGWLGGLAQTRNQNTTANLNTCGGPMNRTSQATAFADWRALSNLDTMPIYTRGANYTANTRLMNLIPYLQGATNINITSITKANPAVVTTASNHGLADDDIIRIQDISSSRLGVESTDGTIWGLTTGFYRVRVTSGTTFTLHHFVTRANINSSGFTGDYPGDARITTVEGIQHEYYRVSSSITNANQNISAQANLSLFFKDPRLVYVDGTQSQQGTSTNTDCPHWRWITGPEQFIWNNRGLAFAYKRVWNESPSPNQNSVNASWTRSSTTGGPSGQQVGEKFKNNMPYRNFAGTTEPNNYLSTEWGLHTLGPQFGSSAHQWNDLINWSGPNSHTDPYGVKGLVVEYGGMENYGDPITRISTKRVIKLFDRRVTKAVVSIKSGAKAGDMLVVGEEELTNLSLSVSGNNSQTVTITGDGSCQNYVDIIQSMIFTHSGSSPGVREISVKLGDVTKPTDSNYYYRYIANSLSYEQANFQASYQNLCGLQGYLAMVTSTNDLTAISNVGLPQDEKIWINGTDECEGGIYRSGFWRYTSGPLEDREFWRTRINISGSTNIDSESACDQTSMRSSSPNVKVGPFEGNNWLTGHPTANNNNYLAYQHPTSVSNRKIFTRNGNASSEVGGFLVQFGGSVGDFTGADIEEDGNMIDVGVGPIRAEMSFCTDGSQNSIYIEDEDSVDIAGLSSGWSKTSSFTSNTSPLTITPPSGRVTSIKDWGRELAKGFYQNQQTSNFTPGNRSIKIKLVYADPALNQEICVLKTIGSRNRVVVSPVSWNNR